MLRPGLCSVTYRAMSVPDVIALTCQAGLECIEWAGDVHVPPGDVAAGRAAKDATHAAGLAVASYGSYLDFLGDTDTFTAATTEVLTAAQALQAPRIRVWAGRTGSEEASAQHRDQVVERIQYAADLAAHAGIEIGLEFHGKTLTDEVSSTVALLADVDRANVRTYWQPHQGMPTPEALATLRDVLDQTSTIHVFSWWPKAERLQLSERAELWQQAFELLTSAGGDHDALLEFVPGDDPRLLATEAATLRTLIARAQSAPTAEAH